jgi:hypothetical protein
MFAKLKRSLALCAFVLVLSVFAAVPAAAQETLPLGLIWVVDEWDGEVLTGRSGQAEGEESDQVVDEWDGEVLTGRATAAGQRGRFLLLVVEEGPGLAVRSAEAPAEEDEVVDEWDGEVLTGRATAGPAGSCRMRMGGAPRTLRVVRAFRLRAPGSR